MKKREPILIDIYQLRRSQKYYEQIGEIGEWTLDDFGVERGRGQAYQCECFEDMFDKPGIRGWYKWK